RQLGQESFARGVSGCDLLGLEQICPPRLGILIDAVEMWFIPQAGTLQIDGPFRMSEIAQGLDKTLPVFAGARWRRYTRARRPGRPLPPYGRARAARLPIRCRASGAIAGTPRLDR